MIYLFLQNGFGYWERKGIIYRVKMEKISDNLLKKYHFVQILKHISNSNINKSVIFSKTYVYTTDEVFDPWKDIRYSDISFFLWTGRFRRDFIISIN